MLEILTFTGVDAKTPMDSLRKIAEKYPRVEFGVLLGDRTGGEAPIFPPMDTVNELKAKGRQMGFKTSIHLCGIFARETLKSLENASEFLSDLVDGFDRVQVNLHPDSFTPGITPNQLLSGVKRISQFAESITPDRVILQQRASWASVPTIHQKIEYLYDRSEGGGIDGIDDWPRPSPELPRMGYSGGIGPDTIGRAMAFVDKHKDARLWLDMEGRIRTHEGFLDMGAVEAVCEAAFHKNG